MKISKQITKQQQKSMNLSYNPRISHLNDKKLVYEKNNTNVYRS